MSENTLNQIQALLESYLDPYLEMPLKQTKAQIKINQIEQGIEVDLLFAYPLVETEELKESLLQQLKKITSHSIRINVAWQVQAHSNQSGVKAISSIKNIIAVASGKGGVGKSTTAVNLALALQMSGAKVGILDADIYGPNQPQMLGVTSERPVANEANKIQPIIRYGMQTMSIGYLIDANQPMVWRGPMVSSALQQLLNDTAWSDLDYLIIDLPPGTGDVQLTLAQKIPVTGAVIITTPQEIALADARKGLAMFRKVKVPILGVIENMSYYQCDHCADKNYLFGEGGGRKMAEQYDVAFLGEIPLVTEIRKQADQGLPIVMAQPENTAAKVYKKTAILMAARLSLQAKNYISRFPQIVVENN